MMYMYECVLDSQYIVPAGQLYPSPTVSPRGKLVAARGDQAEERVAEGRVTRREVEGEEESSPHRPPSPLPPHGERNLEPRVPLVQLLPPQVSVWAALARCHRQQEGEEVM